MCFLDENKLFAKTAGLWRTQFTTAQNVLALSRYLKRCGYILGQIRLPMQIIKVRD